MEFGFFFFYGGKGFLNCVSLARAQNFLLGLETWSILINDEFLWRSLEVLLSERDFGIGFRCFLMLGGEPPVLGG